MFTPDPPSFRYERDETISQQKQILESHKLKIIEKQKELDRAFYTVNAKIELFGHLEMEYKKN